MNKDIARFAVTTSAALVQRTVTQLCRARCTCGFYEHIKWNCSLFRPLRLAHALYDTENYYDVDDDEKRRRRFFTFRLIEASSSSGDRKKVGQMHLSPRCSNADLLCNAAAVSIDRCRLVHTIRFGS